MTDHTVSVRRDWLAESTTIWCTCGKTAVLSTTLLADPEREVEKAIRNLHVPEGGEVLEQIVAAGWR